MNSKTKILVVESDSGIRQGLTRHLSGHPELELVASARNVRTAEPKVTSYQPDVVVLDFSADTVEALAMVERFRDRGAVLRVVALASEKVDERLLVRAAGHACTSVVRRVAYALDDGQIDELGAQVVSALLAVSSCKPRPEAAPSAEPVRRGPPTGKERADRTAPAIPSPPPQPRPAPNPPPQPGPDPAAQPAQHRPSPPPPPAAAPRAEAVKPAASIRGANAGPVNGAASVRRVNVQTPLVVGIGVSTGGPAALARVIPQLPADFPLPVVIVQHMPAGFTASLAESLDRNSALAVREVKEGDKIERGNVYVAQGGKHLCVRKEGAMFLAHLTDDPPECSCRPSVDYMFRSLASAYKGRVLGVVLTGMGEDGWIGSRELHRVGACLLAQDQASSTVFGMPRGPIEEGLASAVTLEEMARAIDQAARSPTCS